MNHEVKGSTLPVLEMGLDPGEIIVSNHGELSWMTSNIQMGQTTSTGGTGGGKVGGLMGGLKRALGGGSIFLTKYEAVGGPGMVAFAAKLPGRIFPIDIEPGAGYLVHRHGWLCGTTGITPTVGLQQSFRGGLYGGDGFVLQKLEGHGTAWIELTGEIVTYDLVAGQTILVHPGHVGLFQDTVSFTITRVPGVANLLFGADGFHLVALTGPGKVYLQTMPLPVLAGALAPYIGGGKGETQAAVGGGMVGGVIGNILGGSV